MAKQDRLAVYVHWPYCARICPYCDFNVYKQRKDSGLLGALCDDLRGWREWSGPREVSSIHFGGGTPSLMSAQDVRAVIETVAAQWNLQPDAEIAIEANPQDADKAVWQDYALAGINRLSLGVQSFHDLALELLGREHNGAQGELALELALESFPSVSLDLIFGWAGQTKALLESDVELALTYAPQHISAYQLTIEEGTAFAKAEDRGQTRAVAAEQSAGFYEAVQDAFTAAGYAHYEVSNFAKAGHRSHHNLAYWQGRDYVGIGPGAHGRLTLDGTRVATVAEMRPQAYQDRVLKTGTGITEKETLSPTQWAEEYLLMGLRIEEGISRERFAEIGGQPLPKAALQSLVDQGVISCKGDKIAASRAGRLVLNMVTEKLLLG